MEAGVATRSCVELAETWLAGAYELVVEGWCQGHEACDSLGRAVAPESLRARSWSATGALTRVWRRSAEADEVVGLEAFARANLALTTATRALPGTWNDDPARRKSQVLDAMLAAVSLVRIPEIDA